MPKAFNECRARGGKIRTVKPSAGTYMKVCVRPGGEKGKRGGRTVSGELKRVTSKK